MSRVVRGSQSAAPVAELRLQRKDSWDDALRVLSSAWPEPLTCFQLLTRTRGLELGVLRDHAPGALTGCRRAQPAPFPECPEGKICKAWAG